MTAATDAISRPAPRSRPALVERLMEAWRAPDGRPAILGAGACVTLLGILFWANLRHLVSTWSSDANYSHGFLVPLISLYFAQEAARRGPTAYRPALGLAALGLGTAVAGRLATTLVPVGFVGDLSLIAGLAGTLALMAGGEALRRYGFALAFLIFMVPLPVNLYTAIATPMQLLVSKAAAAFLTAGGLPVLCEGNHLTLPGGVRMFVAEACSGMRQMTGFLALTTAVAFLSERPLWYRLALIASALPIALAANVARVVVTGWLMSIDPRYAEGALHTVEGLLMMGLGLGLLNLECRALEALRGLWGPPTSPASPDGVPNHAA